MVRALHKTFGSKEGCSGLLNEFVVLERGLSAAGFPVTRRHPDVQSPGRSDALHVQLDQNGAPTEASLLKSDRVKSLWTLRSGKHNSFPYVQLKKPLLSVPREADWHEAFSKEWRGLSPGDRRRRLSGLAAEYRSKLLPIQLVRGRPSEEP